MARKSSTRHPKLKWLAVWFLAALLAFAPGICLAGGGWQLDPNIPVITLSDNADLSDLHLVSGSISPAFNPNTTSYSQTYHGTNTQVVAKAAESHATITVNGTAVASGQWSQSISLNPGANIITVKVTAQNGVTARTYTITVNKPASSNANLTELNVSIGALNPAFAPGTSNYTATEANSTTSVQVIARPENDKATLTINGGGSKVGSSYQSTINLGVGSNNVLVIVTSEDKSIKKTYHMVIIRENGVSLSTDAALSDLITNCGALTPAFIPATTSYTQPYSGPNILVKPAVSESHATVTVKGAAVASGQWSQAVTLVPGVNTIPVKVTAQDGITSKTYTISITMPGGLKSSDATLNSLTLSSGALSPAFSPAATSYTQSVENNVAMLDKISGNTNNAKATAAINGKSTGGSGLVLGEDYPLSVGDNVFTILVTAEDQTTTKTYTVTVTRAAAKGQTAPSAPTGLTAVAVSGPAIKLTWTDNSDNELGFVIERKSTGGSYAEIEQAAPNTTSYTDAGLSSGTTYYYRLFAFNNDGSSGYSNQAQATTPAGQPPQPSPIVIRFYIGSSSYYIDDQIQTMDASPIVTEGRTLLPIVYVATPLGAGVDWDQIQQKATVSLNGKTIEMFIGQSNARVNGVNTPIDPDNPNVAPTIVPPGRTMLPLRFISENLGARVDWNGGTQEVKITYPQP
ncbi:MAG: cadherin-like beta sandwich domain-containing protein [Syntrophomonadaceae bacterium]|nr:cadherin-like beta sandwich domain-containing protein [Syntrophomonadaceae bacterium]